MFVETVGVASVAGGSVARISNPHWIIKAKGVEYGVWEATPSEAERDILSRAIAWWTAKRDAL